MITLPLKSQIHESHGVDHIAASYPTVWCSHCARMLKGEYTGITPSGRRPCPDQPTPDSGSKETPGGELR